MANSSAIFRAGAIACISLCTLHASHVAAQSAPLNITESTGVPGAVLKPGPYTVAIVDTLDDRVVIHVDGKDNDSHLTFLGVVKLAPEGASASQPVAWDRSAAHKHYLRGFTFQPSTYVEFVYPKAEAAAIAKANERTVIAIDPESESRPELAKLSPEDRKVISLWMLTPTTVGPEHGLEAKHYEGSQTIASAGATPPQPAPAPPAAPPAAPQPPIATPAPVASVAPRPPAPQPAPVHRAPRVAPSQPVETASNQPPAAVKAYRPAIRRLPQTGSEMPLLWAAGFSSLFGASAMRLRRSRKA